MLRRLRRSGTALDHKQEELTQRESELRSEVEKLERMIADAPRVACATFDGVFDMSGICPFERARMAAKSTAAFAGIAKSGLSPSIQSKSLGPSLPLAASCGNCVVGNGPMVRLLRL